MTPELLDGGIWRIPLPLPFDPPFINVYLLPCPGGWMLIDTGLQTPESWDALTEAMNAAGATPSQLRHIVLTHMHPDHCGAAPRLRDASGATVWMHHADAEMLVRLHGSRYLQEELEVAMREAGTHESMRAAVLTSFDRLLGTFPLISPDAYLEDGQEMESWVGSLHVLWTPGHSPGLCCLYSPELRVLFSSDHVIDDITPHIGWLPAPDGTVNDTLGQYLESLDRLDGLDVERILSAHGQPFTGLKEWTAATRVHHATRSSDIRHHQEDGITLADDLVRRLWPRELRPLDYQFALTEVMAHLEHARR